MTNWGALLMQTHTHRHTASLQISRVFLYVWLNVFITVQI